MTDKEKTFTEKDRVAASEDKDTMPRKTARENCIIYGRLLYPGFLFLSETEEDNEI